MQENYAFIADAIDTRCRTLTDIADAIWDRPVSYTHLTLPTN